MKHADDNAYWTHPAHSTRVMHAHLTHVRKVWCTLECMNALQTVWMHIRHMWWRYDAHKRVWMHMRHLFVMQACLMCRWCALGRVHAYWWCTLDTPHRTFDCMNAHSTHVLKACSMCIIGSMFHAYHEHIKMTLRTRAASACCSHCELRAPSSPRATRRIGPTVPQIFTSKSNQFGGQFWQFFFQELLCVTPACCARRCSILLCTLESRDNHFVEFKMTSTENPLLPIPVALPRPREGQKHSRRFYTQATSKSSYLWELKCYWKLFASLSQDEVIGLACTLGSIRSL